jgi:putative acyl-CoA dehydrogenase
MTPVVKYWVCKSAPALLYEAMECLGGNGYIEDGPLARYYREAPVNAIWEGSGNVMALDLLRVMERAPAILDEVLNDIEKDLGSGAGGNATVLRAARDVAASDEGSARLFAEQLALSAAGAELRRLGAGRIADAFIATRLGGQWRSTYGMLGPRHDPTLIVESLFPA